MIRQTYQEAESENAYTAFFDQVTSVDLLYIDDLGSERHTDWVVEQLYALVNERYETERSVLVTTNLDEAELTVLLQDQAPRARASWAPSGRAPCPRPRARWCRPRAAR